MSWYDVSSWSNPFTTPMNPGDGQFRTPDQQNFAMPGAAQRDARLGGMAAGAQQRQAPQAAGSDIRGRQMSLADVLAQQMSGQDSIAQRQLRDATDRNISQQQAMAQSARPGMAAQAALQASQNAGLINSGLAGQSALAGIQERQAAAQSLGGVLQGARGLDEQRALQNAGMQLQQGGQNDAFTQALMAQQLQNAAYQQQGGMGYEQARTQRYMGSLQSPTWGQGLLAGGVGIAGALL
jgi:hypothetical protein